MPPNDPSGSSSSPVENEDAMDIESEESDEPLVRSGSKSVCSWCHHLLRAYKNTGERKRKRMQMAPSIRILHRDTEGTGPARTLRDGRSVNLSAGGQDREGRLLGAEENRRSYWRLHTHKHNGPEFGSAGGVLIRRLSIHHIKLSPYNPRVKC